MPKKAGGPGGKKRERQGSVVARYAQKKAEEAVEQEKKEMAARMKELGVAIDESDAPPEIAPPAPTMSLSRWPRRSEAGRPHQPMPSSRSQDRWA
jgi:hypothetical protein